MPRLTTFKYTGVLTTEECCNCGMMFAMPEDFQARKRRDKTNFFCPDGHRQYYLGETDRARHKRELEEANRAKAAAEGRAKRAEARTQTEKRRAAAARGLVTKIKNKIARGECPCCGNTYKRLARHMATKHPDFLAPEE